MIVCLSSPVRGSHRFRRTILITRLDADTTYAHVANLYCNGSHGISVGCTSPSVLRFSHPLTLRIHQPPVISLYPH